MTNQSIRSSFPTNQELAVVRPNSVFRVGKVERRTVSQLTDSDEPRHIFIEDLKPTTVFLWFARIAKATGAVEYLGEGFEVDYLLRQRLQKTR